MSDFDLNSALAQLDQLEATRAAYNHAMSVMSVDAVTAAPAESAEGRGRTMEVLSGVIYRLTADPKNRELLEELENHADSLDATRLRQVQLLRKEVDQLSRIPQQEYVDYTVLLNQAGAVWHKAKNENDFAAFAPYLDRIVEYNRKFAGYYNPALPAYDALLNEYEEGLTTAMLDEFFDRLRRNLVPLIHRVSAAEQIDDSFLSRHYPVEQQRRFSQYLMQVLGIDPQRCTLAETEHPFTDGNNNRDVRITTHYYEDRLDSSMYSVIHEGGHALYELGGSDEHNFTCLQGGVSMGIHESQSRFYENLVGRSRAFIQLIFPKMQELFPEQLRDVTAEQMYRAVNRAQPSLIRTEADELTYSLHVMVRYELEKRLIDGTLAVRDLPKAWNDLYREYLGVEVPDDTNGCLQDSHWSGGSIGYFPSYALGSAYAVQMKAAMERELGSVEDLISHGELDRVTQWLGEHIHRYGRLYPPCRLLEMCCGGFDPQFYIDYLTGKYTELYHL